MGLFQAPCLVALLPFLAHDWFTSAIGYRLSAISYQPLANDKCGKPIADSR
jgi:hypothetical protein